MLPLTESSRTYFIAGCRQKPAWSEQKAPEGVTVETVLRFGPVGDVETGAVRMYPT